MDSVKVEGHPHAGPSPIKMDTIKKHASEKSMPGQRGEEPRLTAEGGSCVEFSAVTPMMAAGKAVCTPTEDSDNSELLAQQKMTGIVTELDTSEDLTALTLPSALAMFGQENNASAFAPNEAMSRRLIRKIPGNEQPGGPVSKSSRTPRASLTLSAFRRPENTVRIACHDSSRTIESDYDLQGRTLGHGAFSTVRLATRRVDQEPVAVKTIAKHQVLRSRRIKCHRKRLEEWEILQELESNPNIVTPLDVFETDEDIQLVLEFCDGGELFDVIQRHKDDSMCSDHGQHQFPEDQASLIAAQVLSALADLQARGIAHRDVKPENILLKTTEEGNVCVKLSDFGTARLFHRSTLTDSSDDESDGDASPCTPPSRMRAYSSVGSHYYTAPEVDSGGGYGTAVDIYSLGVSLYVLLCGVPPSFDIDSDDEDIDLLGMSWSSLSADARDLLRCMLHPHASKRIAASDALRHPWITNNSGARLHMVDGRFHRCETDVDRVPRQIPDTLDDTQRGMRKRPSFSIEGPSKKSRPDNEVGCLIAEAMAKLYSDVAEAANSASEAAACVVFDELGQDVRILSEERDETNNCEDDARTSPLESSLTALSV